MLNFLSCDAQSVSKLMIDISFQDKNTIRHKKFEVDTSTIYKITVADNMTGLKTYNCRIIGYSMCPTEEVLCFVSTKQQTPIVVDTIKIDYSDNNVSKQTSINVSDIRNIEEMSTSGFDEITNREVPTFK